MKRIKCPNCGGTIAAPEEAESVTCEFCKSEVPLYSETSEQRFVYVDAARMRESDNRTRLKEKELEMENQRHEQEREDEKEERSRERRAKHTRMALITAVSVIAFLAIVAFLIVNRVRHIGDIRMPDSCEAFVGRNYAAVADQLSDLGFTDIRLDEHADLVISQKNRFNQITEVSIGGSKKFRKGAWFEKDDPVVLSYHTADPDKLSYVQVPGLPESFIGDNYEVVKKQFENAGFTAVSFEAKDDVTLLTRDYASGDVYQVTIDGRGAFSSTDCFPKDAKVLICLHADSSLFKKIEANNSEMIRMPKKASDYNGLNHADVRKQLESLGFSNVQEEMLDDLTNKKADDAGKVAEVLIDGNSGFKKGDSFSGAKAEVVIRYHSIPAEKQSQVKIDENFKGKQVDIVLDTLGKLNFENVLAVPLGDLESSTDKKNGQVESVTCGGAVMKKGEYYSPGEETIIRYHSVSDAALAEETRHAEERQGKIVMPQSASKYCGKDYEKVEAEMRALGFTKITLVSVNDTKSFEIWNKGKVASITIDGKSDFKEDDYFEYGVEVVITYHTPA